MDDVYHTESTNYKLHCSFKFAKKETVILQPKVF